MFEVPPIPMDRNQDRTATWFTMCKGHRDGNEMGTPEEREGDGRFG